MCFEFLVLFSSIINSDIFDIKKNVFLLFISLLFISFNRLSSNKDFEYSLSLSVIAVYC